MPGAWEWWAGAIGERTYDLACANSRAEVIRLALREIGPTEEFQIVEARSSSAMKYEGADHVPFVSTRNHEIIPARMRPVAV